MSQEKSPKIFLAHEESFRTVVSEEVTRAFENYFQNSEKQPQIEVEASEDIIDIDGAVKMTHYTRNTIYSYVAKGTIPYYKKNRKLLFSKEKLLDWIKESHQKTNAELSKEVNVYLKKRRFQ